MRRFTSRDLMGFVFALALGIAALRNADYYWAGVLVLATSLLIGVATLGGIIGSARARRLGFAVLTDGYFALTPLGLSDKNLR